MFGESEDNVTLALVDAVVENCVQLEPPFTLYCQMSAVAEEEAEILKPLAVMFEVLKVTVGALRSMVVSVMLPPYSCEP